MRYLDTPFTGPVAIEFICERRYSYPRIIAITIILARETPRTNQTKMEALSPRSTNQLIKPKPNTERKKTEKYAATSPEKKTSSSTSKNHADPPPSVVAEPEDGGEKYSMGAFLGKGGFAVCYEGTLSRNGRMFAMKVVRSHMPQKKMEEKVSSLTAP